MSDWIVGNELYIRLGFFLTIFTLVAIGELIAPRKRLTGSKPTRWCSNLSIVVFNSITIKLLFPILAVDVSYIATENQWGLIHWFDIPAPVAIVTAIILLDCAIYFQHVLFHHVPFLWRLHRMHHTDVDIDVTTGARFHPLEIILSMIFKILIVVLLGAPVVSVIIFEVLLNLTAMFNHGNVKIPKKIDKYVRYFLVTPDVHRIHHSVDGTETNRNFGFCLTWWDLIFNTYQSQPKQGHTNMTIGLTIFRKPHESRLKNMLTQPFRDGKSESP
ncbi:sterol desaturase family protein [Vibrio sp. Of7-15]|uniref:sterol desaturase family protein n=1 Tax=Vibrio sp. Of7-15 TaxID=2724879 RepID=UPI001EF2CF17|nr:sterol desaturase family protein [Vibrio sp. Of7-15]MCG7496183.1 sterol desaturase family protein [Vibrio sp. Of7-15]